MLIMGKAGCVDGKPLYLAFNFAVNLYLLLKKINKVFSKKKLFREKDNKTGQKLRSIQLEKESWRRNK